MRTLLERDFVVTASLEEAWDHLARVEEWPSWAQHIKSARLKPRGELSSTSQGVFILAGGVRSSFRMTEWDPPRRWVWVGSFLWLTVEYVHSFEPVDPEHTRLIWTVNAKGFGISTLGRLFARIYNSNLNRAIPLLIAELESQE